MIRSGFPGLHPYGKGTGLCSQHLKSAAPSKVGKQVAIRKKEGGNDVPPVAKYPKSNLPSYISRFMKRGN
jgi:hypothetical protein